MHRAKYTLMQWLPDKFEYGVKQLCTPLPPLLSRQRIPRIDKLGELSADLRPQKFLQWVHESPEVAISQLDQWSGSMDVNLLEEYANILKQNNLAVGDSVSEKLRQFGLKLPSNPNHGHKKIDVLGEQKPLLELLKDTESDPQQLQQWINQSTNCDNELEALTLQWAEQLEKIPHTSFKDPQFALLIQNISWPRQCQLVSQYMAAFVAQNVHSKFPSSLAGLCKNLGNLLEHELLAQVANNHGLRFFHRKSKLVWGLLGASPLTQKQLICLGSEWILLVTKRCKFLQLQNSKRLSRPAFWKTWYLNGTQKRGVLVVNGFLLRQLNDSKLQNLAANDEPSTRQVYISPKHLPMVVPPRPWSSTSPTTIDHSFRGLKLIASQTVEGKATVDESIKTMACIDQLRGLNRLQQQSWKVNRPMLEIVKQLRSDPKLSEMLFSEKMEIPCSNKTLFKSKEPNFKERHQNNDAAIAIADALNDREFWLPMYMDFRGRCYTSHKVLLNFMGNECIRSLFLFGESKPLGRKGLKWLQIHLCNLYGQRKSASFNERLEWVKSNEKHIRGSANDALGETWWMQSSKPFQTLAACMELKKAWDSPSPDLHQSSLPIQLDGTSNGLQHLVALARDEKTAHLVNLEQGKCEDVYTAVSTAMKSKIGRNSIKQAVMTHFYGASANSLSKLLTENREEANAEPEIVSNFGVVMKQKFGSELAIQHWIDDCAKRISTSHIASQSFKGAALVWTSPLGLPVVQPYVLTKYMAIRTELQSFWLKSPYHLPSVESHKQCSSVNANFIHTLDAAHLIKTVNSMPLDSSFASIHDSFWTHPCTVDTMNAKIRKAFAELHTPNLLDLLRQEWLVRYGHYKSLATVHLDSPLYEQLIWIRNGTTSGAHMKTLLEFELIQLYNHDQKQNQPQPLNQKQPSSHRQSKIENLHIPPVRWIDNKPVIGTPGLPFVKMWVPLELANIPKQGTYDPSKVVSAEYFFS